MALWASFKKGIGEGGKQAVLQMCSNNGFKDGSEANPPQTIFLGPYGDEGRAVYNEGYRLGQEAARTKLINAASDAIGKP